VSTVLANESEGSSEPEWQESWRRRRRPPVARRHAEAAEAVVRELLAPQALKITAEPVHRLSDRAVLAYELRWRVPRLDILPSPDEIWAKAQSVDLVDEFDDALIRAELEVAQMVRPAAVLIGIAGHRRARQGLAGLLARTVREAEIPTSRVVWRLSDDDQLTEAIPAADLAFDLRVRGFRVAFADLGDGRTRLSVLARVIPEVLQLDRSMVEGIAVDQGVRTVVRSLIDFTRSTKTCLVSGGIATEDELEVLTGFGVAYGLGPFFGPPLTAVGPGAVNLVRPKLILNLDRVDDQPERDDVPADKPPAKVDLGPVRAGITVTDALGHAARSFQAEHDPRIILEMAADHLQRLIPSDGLCIYEADWDTMLFRPVLARSAIEPGYVTGVMGHTIPVGSGLTGWAFDLGTPQMVNDADSHPSAVHIPGTGNGDESMLIIPLIAGDHRLGTLNLVRFTRDAFQPDDLTMASLVAHMAAAAWRNAVLYAEQIQHAITDPLTGLLNTRWLRDAGRRELAAADRANGHPILMMVDLDNFKMVNDSCGHGAGDVVLRSVGKILLDVVRTEDAAVRYGGEEFVIILHDSGMEGARRVTKELRRRMARIELPPECTLPKVTASVGIASFPKNGKAIAELLGAADTAMYAAKRRGGNRSATA
jgi:diguanylate cyclase (GGDEF)-like protein